MIKTPNASTFDLSKDQLQYVHDKLPRQGSVHTGVKCGTCSTEYLAYWTGDKYPMRDKDTAECKCGATILSWNETESLSLLPLQV